MSTREEDEELFALLHKRFPADEVFDGNKGGGKYKYIKVESIINRLDDVLGPAGWEDKYDFADEVTVVCTLTLHLPDGRRISRQAPGKRKRFVPSEPKPGQTPKDFEADISKAWQTAFTGALKVVARKYGVGRYLKGKVPAYVQPALDRIKARSRMEQAAAKPVVTLPPTPAAEAPPPPADRTPPAPPETRTRVNQPAYPDPPKTGKQLYAWARDRGQDHEFNLAGYLTGWARLQGGYPGRLVDFNAEQVEMAHDEALRKLELLPAHGDAYEDALAN